jgi:hypothetical protein
MIEGTMAHYGVVDRVPRYSIVDTECGAMYSAYRPAGADRLGRVAQFLFPFWAQTPSSMLGHKVHAKAWVPMDDEHTMLFVISVAHREKDIGAGTVTDVARPNTVLPNTSDWSGRFRYSHNDENDYLIDRDRQRTMQSYSGISGGFPLAGDQAVTESMGPILDRAVEHLGTSDSMVIRTRNRLLEAALELAKSGSGAPGVDSPEAFGVRSGAVFLPADVDWLEGIKDLLPPFVEHPELDLSLEFGRPPG